MNKAVIRDCPRSEIVEIRDYPGSKIVQDLEIVQGQTLSKVGDCSRSETIQELLMK